ncbi:hypothetical protein [Pantanalinema sp. GBBB05]|uniref:hypothetical protein n=1 Tax=Pantanalinema sp. GBBB05 TaxID=2604139 RepID=UPI001D3B46CB|nr:hypothetical protein [Pantanalinema sp. GBBB05]
MNVLNTIRRIIQIRTHIISCQPKSHKIDAEWKPPTIYELDICPDSSNQQYQVAYDGQLITEPLDFQTATRIATEENIDAFNSGHIPIAEVVIAPKQ